MKRRAFIPNEEIRQEFLAATKNRKWNQKANTALEQIKEKDYVQAVKNYTGDILLVGISYDKKSKKHECMIEEYRMEYPGVEGARKNSKQYNLLR